MHNYFNLIGKEIRIPQDQSMWQSIVVIFIVDTLGRVRNECLLNKNSMDSITVVEKEALKAIRKHQDWIPGYHNGKKVAVKFVLPLTVGHRGKTSYDE
jgi:periplasmic protein TonB